MRAGAARRDNIIAKSLPLCRLAAAPSVCHNAARVWPESWVDLEAKLAGHGDLGFDSASPGAQVGSVGDDRLELRADGWELTLETDGEGEVAPAPHLVFSTMLANKQRTLRCRPADRASATLRAFPRADSEGLDGRFLVKLARCDNVETGKTLEWPPAPLTVHGIFAGLPEGRR